MYKYLVIGASLLIILAAGYYFNTTGGSDLVAQAVTQGTSDSEGVSAEQVFSGTYECGASSGCLIETKFILNDDTTLEVTASVEENYEIKESVLGQGSWGIGNGGALVLMLNKELNASSSYPTSIIAKKITNLVITDFSTKKSLYPWMKNPVFKRTAN